MSSVSGIRDGDFDRLSIVQDLGVGQDRNFGTNGQVLTSAGEGESLFWGTNSATLPQGLVAGTNITFTPSGTYNGSVETTISATDTGTTYTGTAPIVVDNIAETISLNKDSTLTTISDNLSVVKVPNALTISQNGTTIDSFDGSVVKTIDLVGKYTAGDGIDISGHPIPHIEADTDEITITHNSGGSEQLSVLKVPYALTFVTDGTGSRTGTFDGSGAITIDNRDSDTTYTATAPIDITSEVISLNKDSTLTTISDNLSVVKVPNALTITKTDGTDVVFDGTSAESITLTTDTGITTLNGGDGITITDVSATEKTVSVDKVDGSGLVFTLGELDLDSIPNSNLANSTISGISLGSSLANLTAGTNISFDVGTTYNGSTAVTISAQDTGITDLSEGDGINITDVSATEKTISANIDTNTLEFKTDTLGAPEPKEIAVKKLPHTLTITDSAGTSVVFDGDVDKSITINDNNTEYTATQPIRISASDVISIGLDDYPDGTETLKVNASNEVEVVRVPQKLTAGTNISFDTGTTYDGSTAVTISAQDTGITTLNEGDGINITDVSATEKTISVNIDTNTLEFKTDTLGAPEPQEIAVVRVPQKLTAGSGISFSTGTQYDGSTAVTISTSATGGSTYVSYPHTNTFLIPYISTNPHTASSATLLGLNLSGRYLASTTSISATATSYKIELSFPLNHDQSTIKGSTFYRLDKDTTGTNPYGTSNNQNGINILVRNNNSSPSAPDNRYFGTITSEIIITGLTIGTSYAFCPAFCYHPASGTSSSASIQTGSGMGQFVITATPFSNGTIAPAPSGGDDY